MPQHTFAVRHVDRTDPFIAMTRSLSDESSTSSKRIRKSQVSSKLLASTGSISKYHEECHRNQFYLTEEGEIDRKFRDKISNLKRMIFTVRMSQTPLELNYNGRKSLYQSIDQKRESSHIPIWKPISPYRPSSSTSSFTREKRPKSIASEEPLGSREDYPAGPFIKNLIPNITTLSFVGRSDSSQPYRSRFQAEYERSYHELIKKKRSKAWL